MRACEEEKIDAINVLLRAGADPNITDANGNTVLHHTVHSDSSTEILEVLINHGADVNAKNDKNATALIKACNKGNVDVMNVLLRAGADLNIADANGNTVLYHAAEGDNSTEILEILITHGADVNAKNKKNQTTLMITLKTEDIDAINVLLRGGADPNIADTKGHHAVHSKRSPEILQILITHHQISISHGADVNVKDIKNRTALVRACEEEKIDAINVLLRAGADPNIADANGNTMLHHAAEKNSEEILEILIKHGADVNAKNNENQTTLMITLQKANIDAFSVLLRAGADPNIADANGATVLHQAMYLSSAPRAAELIGESTGFGRVNKKRKKATITIASGMENTDTISVHLQARYFNITDVDGNNRRHFAVPADSNAEINEVLIKHGTDINANNKRVGQTPIIMSECATRKLKTINVFSRADPYTTLHEVKSHGGDNESIIYIPILLQN